MAVRTRTVRPQVARAPPLAMDSQGKRAAGHADRARRVLQTYIHDHSPTLTDTQRCHNVMCSRLPRLQARAHNYPSTYRMTLIWITWRSVMVMYDLRGDYPPPYAQHRDSPNHSDFN